MSTVKTLQIDSSNLDETEAIGAKIGSRLRGGEIIELISDLGGGKTALTRTITKATESIDETSSPTFTIQNIYRAKDFDIHHYDFYRLDEPGIVASEIEESVHDSEVVTIIEWGDIVHDVLPDDRIRIQITATGDESRSFEISYPEAYAYVFMELV